MNKWIHISEAPKDRNILLRINETAFEGGWHDDVWMVYIPAMDGVRVKYKFEYPTHYAELPDLPK